MQYPLKAFQDYQVNVRVQSLKDLFAKVIVNVDFFGALNT
jgi:hypothetical protein